ncbi:hypothetical protein L6R52_37945 [Myxococcota bacterium]|nr:hypothetical protein [Myxococcota bacterium]
MIEAKAEGPHEAQLRASESTSRSERLDALEALARTKPTMPRIVRRIAAGLAGLAAIDREALLRLGAIEKHRDPEAAQVVARWVVEALAAPRPAERDHVAWQRALTAAATALRPGRGEGTERALVALGGVDDVVVARAALAIAARDEAFDAERHAEALVAMLSRPDVECLGSVLSLLGRSRAPRAIGPIIDAMERYAEVNPRSGAPDHARALRRLTGQSLGDDPAAWRAWWRTQN